ncbi:hypothetical protein Mgra_00007155 [Meloidogyne graminicola]|uniref:Transmembrane protein n=1 Tax=Meloidogyne graminicola TaxID=189291 RepID=A0A8S9ZJD3_9BILA|nr:hypothetical protein Mgra_00007155 [Meloidogyne graminicola]
MYILIKKKIYINTNGCIIQFKTKIKRYIMPKLKIFPREPSLDGKFRDRCVSSPIPLNKNSYLSKNYLKSFTMRSRRSSSSASSAQPPFMISAFGTDLTSMESIPSFQRNFYLKNENNNNNNSINCLKKLICLLAILIILIIIILSVIGLKNILLQQLQLELLNQQNNQQKLIIQKRI